MRPNRFLCCSCKSVFPDINKTGWIWIACRVDVNPASQAGVLQLPTSKIWMCFYHADCLESQGVEHIVAVCPQNLTSSCGCVNKWRLGISRGHLASCKSLLQVSPFRLLICSKKVILNKSGFTGTVIIERFEISSSGLKCSCSCCLDQKHQNLSPLYTTFFSPPWLCEFLCFIYYFREPSQKKTHISALFAVLASDNWMV